MELPTSAHILLLSSLPPSFTICWPSCSYWFCQHKLLQSTASQMDSFIASDFNLCHALTTVLTAFIKVYNTCKYHKFTIAYKSAVIKLYCGWQRHLPSIHLHWIWQTFHSKYLPWSLKLCVNSVWLQRDVWHQLTKWFALMNVLILLKGSLSSYPLLNWHQLENLLFAPLWPADIKAIHQPLLWHDTTKYLW